MFQKNKIVPVVILNDIDKAVPVAHALLEGGISVMEVTLRTPNALAIIEKLNKEVPEMITGAGTILNDDHYHKAVKHGAQFIVAPGLTAELAQVSKEYNVPFLPGAITPTEIMQALLYGFDYLKFFPAESYNGYDVLKALSSPLAAVKFCPTGGINIENARKYLALPNVVGVGCSFLIKEEHVASGNYAKITSIARETLLSVG
jgi:2-dehydro-3-deoxyphosphogluconate aldolase/(4S)-4-hydroxy-2-oxoglutarate aldolase